MDAMKVLILDDDRFFLEELKDNLTFEFDEKISIDTFSSFEQVSLNKIPEYEIIFIDYNLEGDNESGVQIINKFNDLGFSGLNVLVTGEGGFFLKTKLKAFTKIMYLEKGDIDFYRNINQIVDKEYK